MLVTAGSVEAVAPVRAVGAWLAGAGGVADGGVPGRAGATEVRLCVAPPAVGPVMVAAVLVTALVTVWIGPTGAAVLVGALAGAGWLAAGALWLAAGAAWLAGLVWLARTDWLSGAGWAAGGVRLSGADWLTGGLASPCELAGLDGLGSLAGGDPAGWACDAEPRPGTAALDPLTTEFAAPATLLARPATGPLLTGVVAGFCAADARSARRNSTTSTAANPPQTHKQTLRAWVKARVTVADPCTASTLPPKTVVDS